MATSAKKGKNEQETKKVIEIQDYDRNLSLCVCLFLENIKMRLCWVCLLIVLIWLGELPISSVNATITLALDATQVLTTFDLIRNIKSDFSVGTSIWIAR